MEKTDIEQFEAYTAEAVRDVFKKMGSMDLTPEIPAQFSTDTAGQISCSVGFTGKAMGTVRLYTGMTIAKKVASHILGIPANKVDEGEMINDALGELSNMVAGQIKSRLCDHGWPCILTIPSVVRGHHSKAKGGGDADRKTIGFRTSNHYIVAELSLKNLQSN